MSDCNHDCSHCASHCEEVQGRRTDFWEKPHEGSRIRHVIGVVSGKGGVGKSMVTSLLAVTAQRRGYKAAILDADITGPSIPRAFGLREKATGNDSGLFPVESKTGIKVMSINLLLPNDTDPVVWRGPVIASTVKQFWTDVVWGDVDYLFVDMPPGTGDVPLTVFQSLPVDGIVIVTSPQELVGRVVQKAVNMADLMYIPVWGLVENMAYFECDECGKHHYLFGKPQAEELAAREHIPYTAELPIQPKLAAACDKGAVELFEGTWMDALFDGIEREAGREQA